MKEQEKLVQDTSSEELTLTGESVPSHISHRKSHWHSNNLYFFLAGVVFITASAVLAYFFVASSNNARNESQLEQTTQTTPVATATPTETPTPSAQPSSLISRVPNTPTPTSTPSVTPTPSTASIYMRMHEEAPPETAVDPNSSRIIVRGKDYYKEFDKTSEVTVSDLIPGEYDVTAIAPSNYWQSSSTCANRDGFCTSHMIGNTDCAMRFSVKAGELYKLWCRYKKI